MGAHHLWSPPRFVNRVENDVVDVIKGQEFRLRHLGEVGGQGAYRGSGCHVDLDRPTDDVHAIDEPQIGNWKTELWIDDLSKGCPRSRFTLISWSIPVHSPKSIAMERLLATSIATHPCTLNL
jgi:hypothetical protein